MLCAPRRPPRAAEISGAGATFPYPIYAKWAEAYKAKTGTSMNYQSIGSGGGIKQIKAKTVDFGASDMPLKPRDLEENGLQQFPMVMGGVVPVVNLPGVKPGELKLDGKTLAGDLPRARSPIGTTRRSPSSIPASTLPDKAIATVHRSDGSGTNFIFTNYLSSVERRLKAKVGENTSVEFPVGLGGKGNEGVAAFDQPHRRRDRLCRIRLCAAEQDDLRQARSTTTAHVSPDASSFQAAAANADWTKAPGFYLILTDQPGKESWPITGATFILMHKQQDEAGDRAARCSPSSTGPSRTARSWPSSSTTCRCRRASSARSKGAGRPITGADGKPVWTGQRIVAPDIERTARGFGPAGFR